MRGGEGFLTENELIKKCKKGDREAFNRLFEIYQSQVVNIAYGMLSDREDAYDASQEVFVRVYKNIGSFKEEASFNTWLYRIIANVCSDILRKRQKNSKVISISNMSDEENDMELPDDAPTPEENMELTERQRIVKNAISQLRDEYRIVITMCDIEDMSYDAIADMLGVPKGTVKSRINRARNALKKILIEKRELF
ncbi:MAG: sigma-70 family RNA polymerase sigma factor [Clostridia bacterium]|nr:sigma-70 family RNA polymerase sigma factor [Clostridia bacterium]